MTIHNGIKTAILTGLGSALLAGCAAAPQNSGAFITGTARYQEQMALPANAVFEALLEDVSQTGAPARVLSQQNISPAGNPPFALRIPYDPATLDPNARYSVRTSIRAGNEVLFAQDQATPVLRQPGDDRVDVVMQRVRPGFQNSAAPEASSPAGALVPAALRRNAWQVTHINGQTVNNAQPQAPSMQFDGQSPVASGNTGCNNYSANYTAKGMQLRFEGPSSTRMACVGSVEPAFLQALQSVRSHRLDGRKLKLLNASGRAVLRLSAVR